MDKIIWFMPFWQWQLFLARKFGKRVVIREGLIGWQIGESIVIFDRAPMNAEH